ncbi:hypothetical protein MHYP_G00200540 [Metynnis hypsauchen]
MDDLGPAGGGREHIPELFHQLCKFLALGRCGGQDQDTVSQLEFLRLSRAVVGSLLGPLGLLHMFVDNEGHCINPPLHLLHILNDRAELTEVRHQPGNEGGALVSDDVLGNPHMASE